MANVTEKNSWLCIYAIAQIGKPYWYGCHGQISTADLYTNTVLPKLLSFGYATYTNYTQQLNVKVHDCAGLVAGALMSESIDAAPTISSDIALGATSQFKLNCNPKSETMTDFPYIPGTLVFHTSGETQTHVGIYVGTFIDKSGTAYTDGVVEAMGHDYGVTVSSITATKWNSWGQVIFCDKDTTRDTTFDFKVNPTRADQVGGYAVDPMQVLSIENTQPFIATVLGESNPTIDYPKLKAARVSAMMFFAGELWDATGKKRTSYESNYANALIHNCVGAGLPYAIYVNVRARNVIEADEECRVLYYVVAKFSPKLGLWLSFQSNAGTTVNDAILEVYYKYIEEWGLKAKCGLYVTADQLSKITWDTFKDRFYLWLISPYDVTKVDDELLDPELFEVPD